MSSKKSKPSSAGSAGAAGKTGERRAVMSDSVPAPPEARALPAEEAAEFHRILHEQTPRVYWTPVILASNVAVFAAMVLFGHANVMSPAAESLVRWGANFGPKTVNGEWWRLFSSMFIHVGIVHLLLNMWVLAQAGPLVERLFGNTAFLILYVLSGLAGSLASLARGSPAVSAGASGAIFGVYGALLGFLALRRHALPVQVTRGLGASAVFFVGYNVFYGISQKGIDLAAHGGGFVAGFLCGLALSWLLTAGGRASRAARIGLVAACGLGLVLAGALALKGSIADVEAAIRRFTPVESHAIDDFNATIDRYRAGKITGAEAATIVDKDVLPPWRASRERLAALRHVPAAQKKLVSLMLRYMKLREEGWELFAEGARQDDANRIEEGNAKNAEAEKVVQEIRKQ
jgi:rhomboid protease GluP